MTIWSITVLAVLGLAMGSFIDALVWRIKHKKNFWTDRSECEHCHHKLDARDLVPVLSWVSLGGKCRYCKKSISWQSPVIEILMACFFVGSLLFWPVELATWPAWFGFVCWLIYLVGLAALFVYDLRWMLLPDKIVLPLIFVGAVDVIVRFATAPDASLLGASYYVLFGVVSIGGFYWLLYLISKGKWVGFGDVKLGILIGLVLGWEKALLALVLANMIGVLVVLPGLLTKKLTRRSKVPFGPFLIAGFIIAGLFGEAIITWYLTMLLVPGI